MVLRLSVGVRGPLRKMAACLVALALLLGGTPILPVTRVEATGVWTSRNAGTTAGLNGIRYCGGRWVATAQGEVATSVDGVNWQVSPAKKLTSNPVWYDAWFTGTRWLVAGSGSDCLFSSVDGVTWAPGPSLSYSEYVSFASDGTKILVFGMQGYVATSVDGGLTFAETQIPGAPQIWDAIYAGGKFVAVGNDQSGVGALYWSTNGSSWTKLPAPSPLAAVTYYNGLYVAVGAMGSVQTTNLSSWSAQTSGIDLNLWGIEYGEGLFVAVGNGGAIVSSEDGISWTRENQGGIANLAHIAYDGTTLLAVAANAGGPVLTRRELSTNADLSALAINHGVLSPTFASGTTSYTAAVAYPVSSISVTPTKSDAGATITVGGADTESGSAANVRLDVGANSIPVVVTAEDSLTTKTYTVTVTRAAASTNSLLANLAISAGTLTPAFTGAQHGYTAVVGNNVTSLDITASTADGTATMTVNGNPVASGSPVTVPLAVGANPIAVCVTAEDGVTQTTFTVVVTRLSNNANLASLSLSEGALSPAFSSGTTSYTADVPYSTDSVDLNAVVADPTATLLVNGSAAASGSPVAMPLSIGANSVTVLVTAQDGTTKTYAITVTRAPLAFTSDACNTSQLVSVGAGLSALRVAAPPTSEALTFTITGGNLPAGITLNADGTFAGAATTAGASSATIQAVDTHGGQASTTLAVTVQAAPAFTGAAANTVQLVSQGAGLASLSATKAAGETLTFSTVDGSLPSGITMNTDGTFSGATTTVGATTATIKATDTHGGSAVTSLAVTVQTAPAFTGSPANTSQLLSVGAELAPLQVTKAAGEALTFALTGGALPAGITLDTNGGFTGAVTTVGTATATIEVRDTHGGSASTTLAVTVQAAPAFTSATTNTYQLISTGASLAALQVTKAPGESLTFAVTAGSLPTGISLNANGSFSGTATATGETTPTIQVTDTHGGVATTTLAVTVQAGPAYTADATNTSQTVCVGAGLTRLTATAAAGESLTFTVTGGSLPAGVSLNGDGTFSGITTAVGAATATIEVTDAHGGRAVTTLAVTVQAAPAFTASPANTSQLLSAGATPAALEVTKAAGETVSFDITSGAIPAGLTFNCLNGTFSGAAITVGVTAANIEAVDTHGGRASTILVITVQEAPAFTAASTNSFQLVSAGAGLVPLEATAAPGETLTFTIVGGALPDGVTLNGNGAFSGTAVTAGETTATVQTADTHGGRAITTLTITVQTAPAFTGSPSNSAQLVSVGAGLTPLAATKAPGETLSFTLTGGALPAGVSLNADGTFAGAVTTVGATSAVVQVTDTHGGVAATTLAVTVQVAPAFTADPGNTNQFISTGAHLAPLQATAAPSETLSFTVTSGALPLGVTLNSDGSFAGAATTPGDTSATITATDAHGGVATTTLAVAVQIGPAFTADPANTSQLVSTGAGLAPLAATKAAGETLTFSVASGSLPAGITLNAADGKFTGTVTTVGAYTAAIQVADTHGGIAATTLMVEVQPAPEFTTASSNTSQLVSLGAGLTALDAGKAPVETLTFSLIGGALPAGVSMTADGTFTGTVTTIGATTATIRVVDTHGGSATTTLSVTVQAAPAFTAVSANTTQLVSAGAGLQALEASAAPAESLTFTLAGGALPGGISLNLDGTFAGTATSVGETTAAIQVADTHGGWALTSLAVTVQPAPAFTTQAANTRQVVSAGAGLAALTATAASGETLTFTLIGGALPAGIALNADGTFTGTVTTVGATTAAIQAADTHGGRAVTTLEVTVQPAPAFTAAATNTVQTTSTGAGLTPLELTAAPGETVTCTLFSGALPAGITLNSNGTFTGTATTAGSTTVTIAVTDTHGGSAATTLGITARQGPVFTSARSNTQQSVERGSSLSRLAATAEPGEALTFSLVSGSLPAGVTLNADGSFSGNANGSGSYTIVIAVVDTQGGRATTNLTVVVYAPEPVPADTTAPVISLKGSAEVTIEVGTSYADPGAIATDNRDGDITGKISITGSVNPARVGQYTIIYTVADGAGNKASTTRTVRVVDTTKPVITLNGQGTISLKVGDTYAEAGATAADNYDGDLTARISISGAVNTGKAGLYTLTYSVTDSSGNISTARRTATVTEPEVFPLIETSTVTTDESGRTVESFALDETAASTIATARTQGQTAVAIALTSSVSANDPSQAGTPPVTEVSVPNTVLQAATDMDVKVTSNLATLELPSTLVNTLATSGQQLSIRIDRPDRKQVQEKVGEDALVVSAPIDISTSLVGKTRITFPCDLALPTGEPERQDLLNSLGMFVVHSDGAEQTIFDLTFDIEGDYLRSVSFWVDRFSTFALVRTATKAVNEPVEVLTVINSRSYTVKGGVKPFDSVTAFYGKQGVTVMALRLFEELGATFTYEWRPGGGVITMAYPNVVVTLTEGSTKMLVQDESGTRVVNLRTAVVNRGGRAFIPTRDVSESLGFQVEWQAATDSITITRK